MPPVVGEEGQPQLRDQDVVDLILRVHGAGAGDDVIAPGQCLGTDQLQQQARHGTVFVPEHDEPVSQRLRGVLVEHLTLWGHGREQPQLFAGSVLGAGQQPGTQSLDVAAHFFKVGAAGLGPAAVQQQAPGRSDIPRSPRPQRSVAGEQRLDLFSMGAQGVGLNGMVQAQHYLVGTGRIRLYGVGRGGIYDGPALPNKDHAVKAVRVAGAVDALHRFTLLDGPAGQLLHQGGLAAARPAFDQHHLHAGLPAQRLKIALEPGGGGGPQKEIDPVKRNTLHKKHLAFALKYAKKRRGVNENETLSVIAARCQLSRRASFSPSGCYAATPPSGEVDANEVSRRRG